jgi:hypothetical protein
MDGIDGRTLDITGTGYGLRDRVGVKQADRT